MLFQRRAWNRHGRLLYSAFVWFSTLGDYVRGGKGEYFTVQRLPCTIECHTIPVSKYLMVIEALYSTETILRQRTSHVQHFSLLLCFSLFVSSQLPSPHCRYCTWPKHSTAHYCPHIMYVCVAFLFSPVYPIISQINRNSQTIILSYIIYILWNVFFILISFKTVMCFMAPCGLLVRPVAVL